MIGKHVRHVGKVLSNALARELATHGTKRILNFVDTARKAVRPDNRATPHSTSKRRPVSSATGHAASVVRGTRTRTQTRRGTRVGVGAPTSKSAGKFKLSKRSKKDPTKEWLKKGTCCVYQTGGVSTVSQTSSYIGHSTGSPIILVTEFWRCLVKMAFIQMGGVVTDPGTASFLAVADQLNITCVTENDAAVQIFDLITAASQSINTLAANAQSLMETSYSESFRIITVDFVPTTGSKYRAIHWDTTFMSIHFWISSHLKLQNRTIGHATQTNVDEQNAEEVDNVPLYGKSYGGSGNNFTVSKRSPNYATTLFTTRQANGLVYIDGTVDNEFKDPIQSGVTNCRLVGKAKLDPGEIKTSSIEDMFKISQTKFWEAVGIGAASSSVNPTCSLGKYHVFGFERMIDTLATSPTLNIGFENDFKIYCTISSWTDTRTMSQYVKSYLTGI